MAVQSSISQFFRNKKILVTGSTGLVGKCLVEKLIRDAPDLNKLYLLLRPKEGESSLERSKKYFKSVCFERIQSFPQELVQFVPGDLTVLDCGLNPEDKELLADVDIVLHSAADVSFGRSIQTAVKVNTGGTKHLLDLALGMKNIQSFVSLSTACSSPNVCVIEEKVYPANLAPLTAIELFSNLPPEWSEKLTKAATGPDRNSYLYSKQLAENLVQSYGDRLPVCIVRPGAVLSAIREPHPGWIDTDASLSIFCKNLCNGTYHTSFLRDDNKVTLTPVDTLVNTTLAAAWRQSIMPNSNVLVYNCVPVPGNYISYQELMDWGVKTVRKDLPAGLKYLPRVSSTRYYSRFLAQEVLFRFIPSLVYNTVIHRNPKESVNYLLFTAIFNQTVAFKVLESWRFVSDNMKELNNLMSPEDRERYPLDFNKIDWKTYIVNNTRGLFKFCPSAAKESKPRSLTWLQVKYWSLVLTVWSPLWISGIAWTPDLLSLLPY